VASNGNFYLLTAHHIFNNNDANPTGIVVSCNESGVWWSTNACIHLDAESGFSEDNSFSDVAVYSLETSSMMVRTIGDFDFLPFPKEDIFPLAYPMYASGFPDQEADVDLDLQRFVLTMVPIEGEYAGATSLRGIHVFKSKQLMNLNPGGMSGGPITVLDSARLGHHLLVGLIMQGGGNDFLHFLGADFIVEALRFSIPRLLQIRQIGPIVDPSAFDTIKSSQISSQ
jgi:hypothetical protein